MRLVDGKAIFHSVSMDRLTDDWRWPTHSLYYSRAHTSFSKPCNPQWPSMPALKCSRNTNPKIEIQMLKMLFSTQAAASPSFNFLTASSLNCCFSCTFMVVDVDDDEVLPARKPNIPFPWLLQTALLHLTAANQKN